MDEGTDRGPEEDEGPKSDDLSAWEDSCSALRVVDGPLLLVLLSWGAVRLAGTGTWTGSKGTAGREEAGAGALGEMPSPIAPAKGAFIPG